MSWPSTPSGFWQGSIDCETMLWILILPGELTMKFRELDLANSVGDIFQSVG